MTKIKKEVKVLHPKKTIKKQLKKVES